MTKQRDPELEVISRVRSLATWLRKTGEEAAKYPKLEGMSSQEIRDAQRFAVGFYPWPSKWTVRLYHIAKDG
jgi:hypothetical protein